MEKDAGAFRTIGEVAEDLDIPQHVLRFWETRFPQIKPLKRAGGRRFYRPADVTLLRAIRELLYGQGYTIKGVQKLLREQGGPAVATAASAPAVPRPLPVLHEEHKRAPPRPLPPSETVMSVEPGIADPPAPTPAPRLTEGDRRRLEAVFADLAACTAILSGARIAGR